jgi:hypothetical protein
LRKLGGAGRIARIGGCPQPRLDAGVVEASLAAAGAGTLHVVEFGKHHACDARRTLVGLTLHHLCDGRLRIAGYTL